jgi:hypothetical protein
VVQQLRGRRQAFKHCKPTHCLQRQLPKVFSKLISTLISKDPKSAATAWQISCNRFEFTLIDMQPRAFRSSRCH